MIKITKKTDYGLTLLAALAKEPEKLQSLRGISVEYHLPYKFIGQVASLLMAAKIITSKEGATGGYKLSKPAEKITLLQVINVLDGPVVKVDCLRGKTCVRKATCSHHHIMVNLSDVIDQALSQKTLADLV